MTKLLDKFRSSALVLIRLCFVAGTTVLVKERLSPARQPQSCGAVLWAPRASDGSQVQARELHQGQLQSRTRGNGMHIHR